VTAAAGIPVGDNEMRNRVEEIFHEVADLSAEARARYFTQQGIDTKTRIEVEALVLFDADSSTSLERDIEQVAQRALARFEPKGLLSGRYLLGEFLGRGGMGTVYLAERVDGEVAQRVAVKFLRPGADDPQLRQRFLAERQILASLSHPNIARLLDAGHREDGQPYLVMEYVAGQAIDVYTSGLGIRPKIDLFLKVCSAVGYLHRNLVVHRDLKPANILVTREREPKLLDFGIAKMLDLTTDSTVTAMRMLTPDFASPEQVDGGLVSTATDIYSMGAVLYKLLTGRSPHQFGGDSAGAIALAISSGSITPPARLAPALKGDLEFIVLKALRREPQERYATIEQLAEDLENYLESRPIRARKGDAWYRTRKLLRRYWLPVAATVLPSRVCPRVFSWRIASVQLPSADLFRFVSWPISCLTSTPKFDGPREPPRSGS
jgi:serine/threonine protein kinase